MNKIRICILCFIFLFSDYTHTTKSSNRVIQKLIRLGSNAEKIEDIFAPIDTVRFEYTPNSVLGAISQICKHPNGYLVLDDFYSNEVHLYNNKGIFIKKLGSKGQGPCEYQMPHYIFIDSLGNSYILDRLLRKIISFDLQGNYIFVMARYFGPMNVKTNNYYLFFTNEGDPLDILLREDNSKHICGCCENDIYIYLETTVEEENPAIIRYRLKE